MYVGDAVVVDGSNYKCICYYLRDRSLITCGDGVEDILIYLMEFSSPLSDLCRYFDPHSRTSEDTP